MNFETELLLKKLNCPFVYRILAIPTRKDLYNPSLLGLFSSIDKAQKYIDAVVYDKDYILTLEPVIYDKYTDNIWYLSIVSYNSSCISYPSLWNELDKDISEEYVIDVIPEDLNFIHPEQFMIDMSY